MYSEASDEVSKIFLLMFRPILSEIPSEFSVGPLATCPLFISKLLHTKLLIDFCKEKSKKKNTHKILLKRPVKNWWKMLQREWTVFFHPQLVKFNSLIPSYPKHSHQFFISTKRKKHGALLLQQTLCKEATLLPDNMVSRPDSSGALRLEPEQDVTGNSIGWLRLEIAERTDQYAWSRTELETWRQNDEGKAEEILSFYTFLLLSFLQSSVVVKIMLESTIRNWNWEGSDRLLRVRKKQSFPFTRTQKIV